LTHTRFGGSARQVILGENAIGADEQRRTALFQQPWVAEAVVHYLSDRVRPQPAPRRASRPEDLLSPAAH